MIIDLLKSSITVYQDKLQNKINKKLNDREKRILEWLFIQYKDEE